VSVNDKFEYLKRQSEEIYKKSKPGEMLDLTNTTIRKHSGGRILVFGMNPSGGKAKKPYLFYVKDIPVKNKEHIIKKLVDRRYNPYFKGIYKLFPKIKMVWEDQKYLKNADVELKQYLKLLSKPQNQKVPYLLFSDLIFIKEKDQKKVETIIKENKLEKKIFEFFKKQLEYYAPKMVVIASAYGSDLISKKISNNKPKTQDTLRLDNGVTIRIIYSSMVSGGHIDKYNKERLKKEIKEVGKELKLW
jgi:hypothetical protein